MQRPKEFDAKVLAYMPALRALAIKLSSPGEREDLIQDTIIYAMTNWRTFRGDPCAQRSGFYQWLVLNMRSVAQGKRRKRQLETTDIDAAFSVGVHANQENIAYASQIVRRLSYTREGRMLVRIGTGETVEEIGKRRGITSQRVSQLTGRARDKLVERASHKEAA
jgi:RNA polymerase sigma factor (sigma-70 family)